jgi:hypothetical protein
MSRMNVPTDFSKTQATNYEPVPADNHVGILIGITDLGTHMESYKGAPPKPKRKIRLQWELPDVTRADGSTATISAKYTYSMHENASFRQVLDKWLGAGWPEQHKGQSWEFLLEMPAMVQVEQVKEEGDSDRVFSVVAGVSKVPARLANDLPKATRDSFFLDLDDKHLPEKLSLKDAEYIRESSEYKAGGFKDEAPRPGQGGYGQGGNAPRQQAQPAGPAMGKAAPPADDDMSDVPFADPDPVRFLPPLMAREEIMRRFESTDPC